MKIKSFYLLPFNTYFLIENMIFNYIVNEKKIFTPISHIKKEINCLFKCYNLK
jgi:hypothetical protein